MSRRTDQIKKITDIGIPNYQDSYIIIDSEEKRGTYRLSINDFLKIVSNGYFNFTDLLIIQSGEQFLLQSGEQLITVDSLSA